MRAVQQVKQATLDNAIAFGLTQCHCRLVVRLLDTGPGEPSSDPISGDPHGWIRITERKYELVSRDGSHDASLLPGAGP